LFETLTRLKGFLIVVFLGVDLWAIIGRWQGIFSLHVSIVNGGLAICLIGLLLLYLEVEKEKENEDF